MTHPPDAFTSPDYMLRAKAWHQFRSGPVAQVAHECGQTGDLEIALWAAFREGWEAARAAGVVRDA